MTKTQTYTLRMIANELENGQSQQDSISFFHQFLWSEWPSLTAKRFYRSPSTQPIMALIWTLHAEAPAEDLHLISEAIFSHIRSQAFGGDAKPIACLVYEGEMLIAGGSGRTEYQRLFVHDLWVAEEHRRQGLASRILKELESEAARRGCRDSIIETLDDSVANLYRRLGSHLVAHMAHYLGPFNRHIMLKTNLAHPSCA